MNDTLLQNATEEMKKLEGFNCYPYAAQDAHDYLRAGTRVAVKDPGDGGIWVFDRKPFADLKDGRSAHRLHLYARLWAELVAYDGDYDDGGIYPPPGGDEKLAGYTVVHRYTGVSVKQFRPAFLAAFGEPIKFSRTLPLVLA